MLGDVWEWRGVGPYSLVSGGYRVIRSGSWGSQARYVRAASRSALALGDLYSNLGLRLARDQDE